MLFDTWSDSALCRSLPPDLFFSEDLADVVAAKKVCFECPVQEECLDAAVRNGEDHGIWGGVGQEGRRSLASILLTKDVFAYTAGLKAEMKASAVWAGLIEDDRPVEPASICGLCGDPVRPGKLPTRRPGPGRTCGIYPTYNAGCRCDRCVRAKIDELARQKGLVKTLVPTRGAVSSKPQAIRGDAMSDTEVVEPEVDVEAQARIEELENQLGILELELEANDRLSLQMFPEELFRSRALNTSELDPEDPLAFAKLMYVLQKIEDGVQFWLGDAMLWGEEAFDAAVWGVITSRRKFKTLMNYRRVCEVLGEDERVDDAEWSVHRLVAESFPTNKRERKRALSRAVKGEWTYSNAADYCRGRKAELSGDPLEANEDNSARNGDSTVDAVDVEQCVWAVRISGSGDENGAIQQIANELSARAEELIDEAGLYSASVKVVYAAAQAGDEE